MRTRSSPFITIINVKFKRVFKLSVRKLNDYVKQIDNSFREKTLLAYAKRVFLFYLLIYVINVYDYL